MFIDEPGFMLQPLVRRTWAPQGRTPIQYAWDRHDRLAVLSALTLSPGGNRLGLPFDVWGHDVTAAEVAVMLRGLWRRCPKGFILVLDRLNAHRSAVKRLPGEGKGRIEVEWLPPYSPKLNPVERAWGHAKCDDLPNFVPKDAEALRRALEDALAADRKEQPLLRSFFAWAGLTL